MTKSNREIAQEIVRGHWHGQLLSVQTAAENAITAALDKVQGQGISRATELAQQAYDKGFEAGRTDMLDERDAAVNAERLTSSPP